MSSVTRVWFLAAAIAGCTSGADGGGGSGGAGGTSAGAGGTSGGASGAGGASGSGGASGDAGSAEACPPQAPAPLSGAVMVKWPILLMAGDAPLAVGTPFQGPGAVETKLTVFRFYLSDPVLIDEAGKRVAAQLVDGANGGTPRPYGLLLVDAAVPASLSLDLLVPAGRYKRLEIGIGVPESCNHGDPTKRVFPLNTDADMFWTWGSQYLFVRIEGTAKEKFAWHVGFSESYRIALLSGDLEIAPTAQGWKLYVDVNKVLADPPEGAQPTHTSPLAWIPDNMATRAITLVR